MNEHDTVYTLIKTRKMAVAKNAVLFDRKIGCPNDRSTTTSITWPTVHQAVAASSHRLQGHRPQWPPTHVALPQL